MFFVDIAGAGARAVKEAGMAAKKPQFSYSVLFLVKKMKRFRFSLKILRISKLVKLRIFIDDK